MRQLRTSGSVDGVISDGHFYSDPGAFLASLSLVRRWRKATEAARRAHVKPYFGNGPKKPCSCSP